MVNRLNEDERIDEIARLSSGAVITDAARDAARHLLDIVDKEPKKKKKA
jgi:DNA repair ATPase RecN